PGQVAQPVTRQRTGHEVVEPDLGRAVGAARAVEGDLDVDLGLPGLPVHHGGACHACSSITATSASLNAAISAGVPTDTRSQPSGPVSRISTPRSSNPCQTACRSAYRPNSTKLASLSATSSPCPA